MKTIEISREGTYFINENKAIGNSVVAYYDVYKWVPSSTKRSYAMVFWGTIRYESYAHRWAYDSRDKGTVYFRELGEALYTIQVKGIAGIYKAE